jgi:glutaredoxin 3
MPHVRIYTKIGCPFCARAKALLTRKGVVFEEIVVGDDPERRAWLAKISGQDTVPQVFAGERALGGFSDISELDRLGQLDVLTKA